MNASDVVWFVLVGCVVVAVIAAAAFAWKLHRAGVSNQALPGQVALRSADFADELRDRIVKIMAEEAAKLAAAATLKNAYFDAQDFVADVGRLPPSYARAVTLDGKLVRNGDLPADTYATEAGTGNVKRT